MYVYRELGGMVRGEVSARACAVNSSASNFEIRPNGRSHALRSLDKHSCSSAGKIGCCSILASHAVIIIEHTFYGVKVAFNNYQFSSRCL